MSKTMVYQGPRAQVTVPGLGEVKKGEPVEVPDHLKLDPVNWREENKGKASKKDGDQ